ncbi:MAG: ABC transporter permease [Dehalococcoidia bacterium]|nr:ABC transporter permease [Dehalococcoidia bacterium]
MNLAGIRALVVKDFTLFFRNRFFALVTPLALVVYVGLYFIMPRSVDETMEIGLYAPGWQTIVADMEQQGLRIHMAESEDELKDGVTDYAYVAGIVLPADLREKLASGEKPGITLYVASDVTEEAKEAVASLMREMIYTLSGQPLAVEFSTTILPGPDMAGEQIPPRDRMRPLFAVFLVIFETFGMATLITEEIERRTIQALLVTPVSVKDLFAAKGITGITLAFGQAALFMAFVGGLNEQPAIIILALLLAALLVTGVGFLMASLAKDMMSVLAWGVLALVILVIPAMGTLFPGVITGWAKIIPSYYVVDTVDKVANYGSGWPDVWQNLLILVAFSAFLLLVGMVALRRRFQ